MQSSDIFIYNDISWADIRIWLHSFRILFENSPIFKKEQDNLQDRNGKCGMRDLNWSWTNLGMLDISVAFAY